MRKVLLAIAASLAMMASPAYANLVDVASVNFTGGTFQYNDNGGLSSSRAGLSGAYYLVAELDFNNLVTPSISLNEQRHFFLDASVSATLDSSPHTPPNVHTQAFSIDAQSTLNGIFSLVSFLADFDYALNPNNTSGTLWVGLMGNPGNRISGADSGDVLSGHLSIQAVPAPGTVAIMLFGLGLLGMGVVVRRQAPRL